MGIIKIKKFRIKSYKKNVKPLLSLKDISKNYDSQPVLDKVNIQVMPSSVVGLLGPNGCGKTTIFNLIMGIAKADSGKIIFNNKEIQNKPIDFRAKMGISLMMQDRPVFDISLEDNLYAVSEIAIKDKRKQKEVVERLIRDFELDSLRKQPARNLSGGQRAKLCLARTLVNSPKLVLIDGNKSPKIKDFLVKTIIKGDQKIAEISAASIIAKVHRDQEMCFYDVLFPGYCFSKHKFLLAHRDRLGHDSR